uniref:Macro domain-containing protein n=1 Tax=Eptatretus burgeri TaxID=7764 RepID=A0A8C4QAS4_EPTBU
MKLCPSLTSPKRVSPTTTRGTHPNRGHLKGSRTSFTRPLYSGCPTLPDHSSDCSIGAGMVTLFEAKVAGVKDLLSHTRKAGDGVVLKRGNRFVYCLITKDSTLQRLMCTCLEAMRNHCIAHGITKVSVPWNGCGLETLNWEKVLKILEDVFQDTNTNISVFSWLKPQ